VAPLPDGGALYVTWSRVLAPLGWPIQTLGVLPQVCTSFGREFVMHQLAELAAGRQPMASALDRSRAARPPLPTDEALAIRAACPAAEGRELDVRVARLLVERRVAYQTALLGPAENAAVR
jgi:carboxyl-terminal processing protease